MGSLVATLGRIEAGGGPIQPDPVLGHAANFLYMLTGRAARRARHARVRRRAGAARRSRAERVDVRRARRGRDAHRHPLGDRRPASATLKGPLHGGANADVMRMLLEIGADARRPRRSRARCAGKLARKEKIPGFGHRVYHTEDPRATHLRQMSRDSGKRTGQPQWFEMSRAHRGAGQGREEAEPERRLLLGVDLSLARHPDRSLHADFRRQPHRGLDGARARAAREQPPDPPARRVHRSDRPAAVGAARGSVDASGSEAG